MPTGGLIAGGTGGLISGAAGLISQSNAMANAKDAANEAVNAYLNVLVPNPEDQKLLLQQYQVTGKMDPRLAKAFQQAQTHLSSITTDPALKQAQMSALNSLENTAQNGGHNLAQDAQFNQNQQQVNAENAGRQGAILQQYAMRGMGQPGGLSLAAQEMNNQNMTGQRNQSSMQAAAQAQQNALASLQGAGNMAGQQQQNEFNQKAQIGHAQDAINQFNTQMNQGVENANVNAQNQAQQYNLNNAQNTANQNTQLNNYQQQYNKQLLQNQFQNNMQKAQGVAAGRQGQAGLYAQQGQQAGNMWGNIGQGLVKAGAGYGQAAGNDNGGFSNDAEPKYDSSKDPFSSNYKG